ncbi:nucleotidyltransferase family protein [Bacillus massiliigorillae]|uniref:nucleotidyltransferase family protein n=1 Tax=Bacillus massiliigorillae TaxID=1243664 RepID=UPI00039FF5D8|nr:nucleotidyltransferase family protein [Bacillus massiliigorillae]
MDQNGLVNGLVGIYLAAGKSSRMGRAKLNLPVGNQYLGSMAFHAALESKLSTIIVVTRKGESLQWLTPFLNKKGWICLECSQVDRGQSASLKAGVRLAEEIGAAGVVVLLADQPFVTSGMINRLVDDFQSSHNVSYISYSNNGILKPPALFTRRLFHMLMKLTGDQGARAIIRGEMREQGKQIEIADDLPFLDIDTEEEYHFLLKKLQ